MADDRLRIDKWLWYARVTKSRTLAQKLVESGHVRVDRERIASANRPVRPGEVLTIGIGGGVRVLKIVALGHRRGPPAEARLLYDDLSAPAVAVAPGEAAVPTVRPDARDRRSLIELKRPDWED